MASMRKLRRRLARWEQYAAKVDGRLNPRSGFRRAELAYNDELDRRIWAETPEIWLGGPEGERALIADVLGDDGRPCDCSVCRPDDDASDWHLADEDDAYDDEGWPWPPGVVVVTEFSDRGLL